MKKKLFFKYSHKDKLTLTSNQKITVAILVVFTAFFYLIYLPISIFLIIFTFIYTLVMYPKRNIYLASRYFICGNTIFYYQNINKVVLNSNSGILTLYSDDKEVFSLEKGLFPTSARKPNKILNNKNLKFSKVSAKIIDKITNASPNVELIGVN